MSGGITHLRSAKCTPLHMEPDGSIRTINPWGLSACCLWMMRWPRCRPVNRTG